MSPWLPDCSEEAKQLGFLSQDAGIGKRPKTLSLWNWLLSSMRERYLCTGDPLVHRDKWNTMEQGIQYLREWAVLEAIYKDSKKEQFPINPDDIQCTQTMCWKFLWNTPVSCVSSLAVMLWTGGEKEWTIWFPDSSCMKKPFLPW